MTRQQELFKGQNIEAVSTKRIVKRAEYDRLATQKPRFGMTTQELYILHRGRNHKAVLERRESLKAAKIADDGRGLKGQTFAHPLDAKDVADGVIDISVDDIRHWKATSRYFCIAINQTHESFWWDIDRLFESINKGEKVVSVQLLNADEYHRPIKVPIGWPWGKSPIENRRMAYMDFPGRVYLSDSIAARPGFDGWGNLHPGGGESEGHYIK